MRKRRLTRAIVVVSVLLVAGALVAAATAVLTGGAGGQRIRVDSRGEDAPASMNTPAFVDLSGANVVVGIPPNQSRQIDATFFAESQCFGTTASQGWCSVRIIATNIATGATVNLNPASGIDYAFDSNPSGAADDLWEGNSVGRFLRLPGGSTGTNWRIRVQWAVTASTTTFRLDDWYLTVQTSV